MDMRLAVRDFEEVTAGPRKLQTSEMRPTNDKMAQTSPKQTVNNSCTIVEVQKNLRCVLFTFRVSQTLKVVLPWNFFFFFKLNSLSETNPNTLCLIFFCMQVRRDSLFAQSLCNL